MTPMKSVRITFLAALLLLTPAAFTPSQAHTMDAPPAGAPKSAALVSFDSLKTLAGEWEGIADVPGVPEMSGAKMHVSMRVTSRGHTLVHELQAAGTPLDPTKYDHPV